MDPSIPRDHPAHALLAELDGLALPRPGPSIVLVAFKAVREGAGLIMRLKAALQTRTVGIAEQDSGHGELYLAERGHLIGCSLVHDAYWLVGRTFAHGMEAIAKGERSRPILLPEDDEVMLYGVTFRHGYDGALSVNAPELW